MDRHSPEFLKMMQAHFDSAPYPHTPLEHHPKDSPLAMYTHTAANGFYQRDRRVPDPANLTILDAGCGTGAKALALAAANPGAKIIGVDLSEKSIDLAYKRMEFHGVTGIDFYAMSLYDLPSLGLRFDYINCDEVLYLLDSPSDGLTALAQVLQPHGVIRGNLHNLFQRQSFFRAQEFADMIGILDNSGEMERELFRETMAALNDMVKLKQETWSDRAEVNTEVLMSNHLLWGDKGFRVEEMFEAITTAGLEFIELMDGRGWNLQLLFKEPDNLPTFLAISLPDLPRTEQLRLFNLLHPQYRLLDFWCGHPGVAPELTPVAEWSRSQWQQTTAQLHPQLLTEIVRTSAINCIHTLKPLALSPLLPIPGGSPIEVDSMALAGLLPLWDAPQPVAQLVQRWLTLYPLDRVSLQPTTEEQAWNLMTQILQTWEFHGYLWLLPND